MARFLQPPAMANFLKSTFADYQRAFCPQRTIKNELFLSKMCILQWQIWKIIISSFCSHIDSYSHTYEGAVFSLPCLFTSNISYLSPKYTDIHEQAVLVIPQISYSEFEWFPPCMGYSKKLLTLTEKCTLSIMEGFMKFIEYPKCQGITLV